MKISNFKFQIIPAVLIIFFAAILRLMPHPANFVPIAALALFGGVYLDKRVAFILPIAAMLITDMILGFHASMLAVYGSFLITVGIGLWVKNHKSFTTVIAASLTSSIVFFILTNFNFWYAHALYPKTMSGLFMSYVNAIPFFRNTVLGDLFYT
ncbi:MAG: hypothetical protein KBD46_02070, partial [Candidatus Levybacteria bacterium]|nr:hypothetical protein [Candidatus Levybacteria bacterium]